MDTKELYLTIKKLLERMVNEKYSVSTIQKQGVSLINFIDTVKQKRLVM